MDKPYVSHEEATIRSFRNDPAFAAEYLNSVLEDGTREEFLIALRRLAEAHGMNEVARAAHLNPKTLYRTLSATGNPELKSFAALLDAMGMRLAVIPKQGQKQL